jgi:hypothetical protein
MQFTQLISTKLLRAFPPGAEPASSLYPGQIGSRWHVAHLLTAVARPPHFLSLARAHADAASTCAFSLACALSWMMMAERRATSRSTGASWAALTLAGLGARTAVVVRVAMRSGVACWCAGELVRATGLVRVAVSAGCAFSALYGRNGFLATALSPGNNTSGGRLAIVLLRDGTAGAIATGRGSGPSCWSICNTVARPGSAGSWTAPGGCCQSAGPDCAAAVGTGAPRTAEGCGMGMTRTVLTFS